MLLTLSTSHKPATDLGYLLMKNPARSHRFDLTYGVATVFYPQADDDLCTVALGLDLDPIALVRGREGTFGGGALDAYVNDRPYAACYLLAQAIRKVFGTAMTGKCKDRPALAETPIPFTCCIYALPSKRGPELIQRLFEPLGYKVECESGQLDVRFPGWGDSPYHKLTLSGTVTVSLLLTQLCVLIPVLDNDKNLVVNDADVERLLHRGEGWLAEHPERALIARRFLRYKAGLTGTALELLEAAKANENEADESKDGAVADSDGTVDVEATAPKAEPEPPRLHEQRHLAVLAALKSSGAHSVIDLGCGDAKFLARLLPDEQFERVLGIEVSQQCLRWARRNVGLRKPNPALEARVKLVQGSITYRDRVMLGYDAAACIEVIEHLDADKLDAFAGVVFGYARPQTVVLTTPNREYNVKYEFIKPGALRHNDHRFEWTRLEFRTWCEAVATTHGYTVAYSAVGEEDAELGAPSQMAVFTRSGNTPVSEEHVGGPAALLPDVEVMLRGGHISNSVTRPVLIPAENARMAFEQAVRFGVDPRWLVYLPPTMSPSEVSNLPGMLEHPAEAFDYYRRHGVRQVVCEEKHMGSRAVLVVCRNPGVARRRFGLPNDANGTCYTRMGRSFFNDLALEQAFLDKVRLACERSGFWSALKTDWAVFDCELMPWSAKAQGLISKQYAPMGAAAELALPAFIGELERCQQRGGQDLSALIEKQRERLHCANLFRDAYRHYCWDVSSLDDYRLAPFHVLATEGRVHMDKRHVWHMETIATVARADDGMIIATPYRVVDVNDEASVSSATAWWEELTGRGGEGMVVKPYDFVATDERGLLQPAIKCRGREYLRIIYGPDYTLPQHLDRLRKRGLQRKRALARSEFALGLEALTRFVNGESVARVHECAFAVLALESEALDPRL